MARSKQCEGIMKKLVILLMFSAVAVAQSQPTESAMPQTARQALIEMFFSKTPGTLIKHLPATTLATLEKSGTLAKLQMYSVMAAQLQSKGSTFETFETGSVLLSGANPQTGDKYEVIVDSDSLQSDEDDIALSFHGAKDKDKDTPHGLSYVSVTFAMKSEASVWKLNDILFTIRLPLADPDFLKKITEAATKSANATVTPMQPPIQTSSATFSSGTLTSEASVVAALRTILRAEITYTAAYQTVGYTCTLSDLDGFGSGEPNQHQAMILPSNLASGKRYGYAFMLSACTGNPASGFHLTAAPTGNASGRRAYCADQTGAIHYSTDGNPATCLASGTPLP
jgi:hypothetical protein